MLANGIIRGSCSGSVVSLGHNLDSGTGCALSGMDDLSNIDVLVVRGLRDCLHRRSSMVGGPLAFLVGATNEVEAGNAAAPAKNKEVVNR
jgi:hypothetical protein